MPDGIGNSFDVITQFVKQFLRSGAISAHPRIEAWLDIEFLHVTKYTANIIAIMNNHGYD